MQKFLLLSGVSRGGKGIITTALSELVGNANFCSIRLKQFASRFGLENAVGKSLIIVPDATMPGTDRAAAVVELFKAIVGCDPVDVDRKGRPIITTTLPAKIVISTNDSIALPDNSAALYNRMLVLKFTESFLGREDESLAEKLRAELPGILRWSIQGYARLRDQGFFTEPKSGKVLKYRLQASGSPIALFVQERCLASNDVAVDKAELYKAYESYCSDFDIEPSDAAQFGKQLLAAVPSIDADFRPGAKSTKDSRPRFYKGIALKPEVDESNFQRAIDGVSPTDAAERADALVSPPDCRSASADVRGVSAPTIAV